MSAFDVIDFFGLGYYIFLAISLAMSIGLGIVLPISLNKKAAAKGKKSSGCAYLLLVFWGLLAIHRFYLGKTVSAILWLFTGGFFGIGFIIDLFLIPSMINSYNIGAENRIMIQQNNKNMQQNLMAQNVMMNQMHNNNNNQNQNIQHPIHQQNPQINQNLQQPVYQQNINPMPYSSATPKLIGISGEYAGVSLNIDGSGIILGRDPAYSQLVFSNTNFSRKHCVIFYSNGKIFIRDHSSNGTFLASGKRLSNDVTQQLLPGDTFYLINKNEMFRVDF